MKELLFFIEDENDKETRKTKRYNVYSNHSKDFLGVVHWRSGRRCYVMSYTDNIDMSIGCHKQLNDFMQKLEDERKCLKDEKRVKEDDKKHRRVDKGATLMIKGGGK